MRIRFVFIHILLLLFIPTWLLIAQEQKKPQAFRTNESVSIPLVLPSTLDLQLLEAFILMQKANAGEAPAQHELGLRYLLGKGFPSDTVKAAFWIQKAADQNLPIAQFNLGVLSMHGWGVEWNPFEAYVHYRKASENDFPQALYIVGLMYTDNLLLPRNWVQAYRFIKRAVDFGLEEAKAAKAEMEKRGLDHADSADARTTTIETATKNQDASTKRATNYNLLFIDFHADTTVTVADTTLLREAYQGINASSDDVEPRAKMAALSDSSSQPVFLNAAAAGNPEALCLIGRLYERGIGVRKNDIRAGVYYLRALHLDSYRAPSLLWKLMVSEEFARELEARSSKNDPEALYVWSGLTFIGYNKLLSEKQSFDLLRRAALSGFVPAIVELGSCYFSGRWIQQDRDKALEVWNRAVTLGSREAEVRIAAANVLGQIHTQEVNQAFSILQSTAQEGSLLSEVALGYCYENGICVQRNKGEAYRIYYESVRRGSETAFQALRRMYDEVRPPAKEFQIPD